MLCVAACAHPAPERPVAGRADAGHVRRRVALFPPENLTGGAVPMKEFRAALEASLVARGLDLAPGDAVDRFLAAHRIRWTGGMDGPTAAAAATELGVEGVLFASVELYDLYRPAIGLTMRLTLARPDAPIAWIDSDARMGDQSPGVLGLGIVHDLGTLRARTLTHLAGSLDAFLRGEGPRAPRCPDGGRFDPKITYRSPRLGAGEGHTVAVLPFVNRTGNRSAAESLALGFVRQLVAVDGLRPIEPGVVRDLLLRFRFILNDGVALDQARELLGALDADLVIAGDVFEYDNAPRVNFNVMMLDSRNGDVVWAATSFNQGDDGVFFFDAGKVISPQDLACRMTRNAVDGMAAKAMAGRRH